MMSCHSTLSSNMAATVKTYLVRRLDGVDQDYNIDKKSNGSELLDKVCKSLGLLEKDYFGLQYTDKNGDHLWINLRNPLHEQLPANSIRPTLEMRVKYFVQPQKLIQPITRVLFYKHLRKELILGRLKASSVKAARLSALIAQIDKGDFHSGFQYRHKIPCSTSDMENFDTRIRREHHKLIGTTPDIGIEKFLNETSSLEHYGMEMYHVVNGNRVKLIAGVGPTCILVLSPQLEVFERYSYSAIHYTAFHARKFTALAQPADGGQPQQIEYELKSRGAAQALYRSVTEFHTFFQQDKVSSVVKNAGYCKSILGSFKNQSPDRFYFDVMRTHREVVNHLWPILNPNTQSTRPPPLPPSRFQGTPSLMSLASQRSTRSLPSHSPRHHMVRTHNNSMQRSVSSDNTTFRRTQPPPPFLPPATPPHDTPPNSSSRRGSHEMPRPPLSPFDPYASSIDSESTTYISGNESDTYVCMRSTGPSYNIRLGGGGSDTYNGGSDTYNGGSTGSDYSSSRGGGSDTYTVGGSDTYAPSDIYINSGMSEVSSSSMDRVPSPPPMYSEVDPHGGGDIPSPPPRSFTMNGLGSSLIQGSSTLNEHQNIFNFDTQQVLSRTRELESELHRLRTAMTCRVCKTQPLGATFCPCGHTICCYSCATRLRQCWQCNVPIDNVQRMVLA